MFICREEPTMYTMPLHKTRPNMPFTIFHAAAVFSHKIFYKWKHTNKQNHNVQDVTPWAYNGERSSVLQGKGKVCAGDFRLFVFKAPSQPSPFPSVHSSFYTRRLACIQTRTHLKPRHTLLHVGLYNNVNVIVLKRHWPLFWTGALIQYKHCRCATTK